MQFSDALEVAIGLSFIFLLLSLVMTALQEAVESVSRQRGKRLIQGFEELLSDLPGAPRRSTWSARSTSTRRSTASTAATSTG